MAIYITLGEIDGKEVSIALSNITELVGVKLAESRASLHVDVEPVVGEREESEPKVA